MEFQAISTASIVGMAVSAVIAILLPIILLIVGMTKFKAKLSSFFIGCGVFFVMALVLEQILHSIVLGATGTVITGNTFLYALYGGLAAAVFEEVGRFVALKFFLKNNQTFENAFMYGVGHGGFEAIVICGLTMISNIVTSVMINTGMFPATLELLDDATREATYGQLSALWTTPSYQFYMGGVERVFAIILQIGMTLIMYQGIVQNKNKYVALTFLIHFAVDFITVAIKDFVPIPLLELLVAVAAIAVFLLAHRISKNAIQEN